MGLRPSELCSHRLAVRRLRRRSPHGVGPRSFPSRRPAPAHAREGTSPPRTRTAAAFPPEPKPRRAETAAVHLVGAETPPSRTVARPSGAEAPSRRTVAQLSGTKGPFEPNGHPSPPAPKRCRAERPPDPPKRRTEAHHLAGRDALPSARRSEDQRPSDIGPLLVSPKAPADRTIRPPVRDPKVPAGSSDSTRTTSQPKLRREYEGRSPMRSEPKLSARRTSRPLGRGPKAPVSRSTPPSALRSEDRLVSGVRSGSYHRRPK
jgi:hypothetical protein